MKEIGVILNKLKISHKILAVIASGIIISAFFAFSAVYVGKQGTDILQSVYRNNVTPLDNLRNIQLVFRELEYRMAGVQADLVAPMGSGSHLDEAITEIERAWSEAKNAMEGPDAEEEVLNAIEMYEKGYKGFKGVAAKLSNVYFSNNAGGVGDLYDEYLDYKPLIFKSIDTMAGNLKESVKSHFLHSQNRAAKMNALVTTIASLGIGFFGLIGLIIVRSINKPISTVVHAAEEVASGDLTHAIAVDSGDEMGEMADSLNRMIMKLGTAFSKIASAVGNISCNSEELSGLSGKLFQGAREQRERGEQVAAASTEMAQAITDVARNTSDAAEATKDSHDSAKAGKDIVNRTVVSITKLADSVGDASTTIHGLGASLGEIGEIVSVIKDIADQTNLLALNAAIEAARSGEHGRGFSVVAEEVKKLAGRTANATSDISSKIATIHKKSEQSISTMEKGTLLAQESVAAAWEAGEALERIVQSSDKAMDMVRAVAAATEEQSSASEEVSQTMEHIAELINQHSSLAEEVEKAAAKLADLAQGVIVQTTYFKTGTQDAGDDDGLRSVRMTENLNIPV